MPIARFMKQLIEVCLITISALIPFSAQAGLMGNVVHAEYMFPEPFNVLKDLGTKTIGADPEFIMQLGQSEVTIDISDTSILITMFGADASFPSAPFSGFHFSFTDINPIANATVASAQDFNVGIYPIAAQDNDIFLNLEGQKIATDSSLTLAVSFVAEPVTTMLFALGLVIMGIVLISKTNSRFPQSSNMHQ